MSKILEMLLTQRQHLVDNFINADESEWRNTELALKALANFDENFKSFLIPAQTPNSPEQEKFLTSEQVIKYHNKFCKDERFFGYGESGDFIDYLIWKQKRNKFITRKPLKEYLIDYEHSDEFDISENYAVDFRDFLINCLEKEANGETPEVDNTVGQIKSVEKIPEQNKLVEEILGILRENLLSRYKIDLNDLEDTAEFIAQMLFFEKYIGRFSKPVETDKEQPKKLRYLVTYKTHEYVDEDDAFYKQKHSIIVTMTDEEINAYLETLYNPSVICLG